MTFNVSVHVNASLLVAYNLCAGPTLWKNLWQMFKVPLHSKIYFLHCVVCFLVRLKLYKVKLHYSEIQYFSIKQGRFFFNVAKPFDTRLNRKPCAVHWPVSCSRAGVCALPASLSGWCPGRESQRRPAPAPTAGLGWRWSSSSSSDPPSQLWLCPAPERTRHSHSERLWKKRNSQDSEWKNKNKIVGDK